MDAADEKHNFEELEEEEEVVEEVEEIEEVVEEEVEEEDVVQQGGDQKVDYEVREFVPNEKGVDDNVDSGGGQVKHTSASGSSSEGKIFVGGVAWETTDESLTEYFRKYGEIVDSVTMKDKHTHKPRGFGFVTFADPSVVDKVLENEHVIDGRTVEVKRTVPREDTPFKGGQKTKKIFVGGIPTSLTEDELKEHFSSYGKVIEHQIMVDHASGRSRGFGFVTFESEESVERLISEGKMHDLNGKQVEIKKAEPKKPGRDSGAKSQASYDAGDAYGSFGVGTYNYGGFRYGSMYYGGSGAAGTGYGRGYVYGGGGAGYGAGYGAAYGAGMYGAGGYGGASNGYGDQGTYGGAYGGYRGGRSYNGGRYHPYGR